jgi:NAD(P)-dependent dehydrogenase (short-subunit alcohol dehydrogenase family)
MTPDDALVTGRTAIVTGAGAGIGRGIAIVLARFGARVVVLEIDPVSGERTAADVRAAGGEAFAIPTDVRDPEQVERAVTTAAERFGGVDVLVNNAGIGVRAPSTELDGATIDRIHELNVRGLLLLTTALIPSMTARRAGAIVNVSSVSARVGTPRRAAYAASKGAVEAMTRSLAMEFGPSGIRVNAVAPGAIAWPEDGQLESEERSRILKTTPLGRIGSPEDIAQAVHFLACAPYITGQILAVDGGRSIYL